MSLKSILTAAVIALVTMHTSATEVPRDAYLDAALQGAWCNSDDGGKSCWGYDQFNKGVSTSCGRLPGSNDLVSAQSRYSVSGNRVCHVVTETGPGSFLRKGERLCFDVLEINEKIQRFKDLESNDITVIYRVAREKAQCPGST